MRQLYKIVILGDGGIGKTTTIKNIFQYLQKKYPSTTFKSCNDDNDKHKETDRTKFIDFHTISFPLEDQRVVWQIWDLQGQRFPSSNAYTSLNPLDHITETVVKNADLILLTYDSSNNATFNELFSDKGFYNLIRPFIAPDQSFLLLASKTDLLKETKKDLINKISIDMEFEEISYNNTFLENISTLSETILTSLHIKDQNKPHGVTSNETPVSLKVYR